jgi:hypothetical protein
VRDDKEVQAMNQKFVLLRMTYMNGVNIAHFTFDYDLTWMGFFLDAGGRIYSRYGGRDSESSEARVSTKGLIYTMEKVLALHKAERAKRLPPFRMPALRRPEDNPVMKQRLRANACIRCHLINEVVNAPPGTTIRKGALWGYPVTETVGLAMEKEKGNVVEKVLESSPADKAGLKAGDELQASGTTRLLSTFDLQQVLHNFMRDGKLPIDARRNGKTIKASLELSGDWRRWDISWRKSIRNWQPSPGLLGTGLDETSKAKLKVPAEDLAFRLQSVNGATATGKAGLKTGDVIVALDGKRSIIYRELNAFFLAERKLGDKVEVSYLRGGKEEKTTLLFDK